MAKYLLDTNVVIRLCNPNDVQHNLATKAVSCLLAQGDECFLTAQIIVEFWVVATRPVEVNGLGWTVEQTRRTINQLLDRFPLLEESSDIFANWLDLVTTNNVMGKRTHDVRILTEMLSHEVTHLLTFNTRDFIVIPNIGIVNPQQLE